MADASHTELPRPGAPRKPGVIANILAIIGFIILIIIVLWGLLHLISLTTPWITGMFTSKNNASITVSAPSDVTAATALPLSWKHTPTERGTYALMYQCTEGLSMTIGTTKIPCGAAYTLGNATGSATVIPTLSGKKSVAANISILFIPSAAGTTGPAASGNTVVTVSTESSTTTPKPATPAVVPSTPATPKPSTPVVTTPKPTTPVVSTPKPVSPADLKVTIVAVGVIDPYTGAFVQRAAYSPNETAAVQFDIQNVGGSHTGSYTFEAQIPTSQPYTYSSPVQPSLAPGSHVVNTLRFSPAVGGTFSVNVYGNDANRTNNYASQWVAGAPMQYPTYQYPSYQYPYQY